MATFERATVVEAPLEAVWQFHADIDGLAALTPAWIGLSVERLRFPADVDGEELIVGTEIELGSRPFGLMPGGTWTVRITARHRDQQHAMFRDETLEGPFEQWIHTHRFVSISSGTLIFDRIEYRVGVPGFDIVVRPALGALFAYRYRRIHQLLG